MDQKPNDRFNLKKLFDSPTEPLVGSYNSVQDVSDTTVTPPLNTLEPHRSGRNVRAPDRFMFLGEAISDEHDLDPSNYNEAISDKDFGN